ncbi:DUF1189 domain-containing protein [Mycoplasmatota bacterium]|nr:DUF1189 domain-containing protein [Mycoplasmatota bacterium]
MYNIIRESIINPKGLIKYHSKKGWFVSLYILFLAVLLSVSMFVFLLAYDNPTVNNQTTACQVVDQSFVCDENDNLNTNFEIYGVPMYFLTESQDVRDVSVSELDVAIIVQGDQAYYRLGTSTMTALDISDYESVSDFYSGIKSTIVLSMVIFTIIQNVMIMLFIILVSTIPFLRFKKEIRYKKIFKMVTFASTPIAILLLINNMLNFGTLVFFILMFLGYRSIFSLQKELYVRSMARKQRFHQQNNDRHDSFHSDDVIDQDDSEDDDE